MPFPLCCVAVHWRIGSYRAELRVRSVAISEQSDEQEIDRFCDAPFSFKPIGGGPAVSRPLSVAGHCAQFTAFRSLLLVAFVLCCLCMVTMWVTTCHALPRWSLVTRVNAAVGWTSAAAGAVSMALFLALESAGEEDTWTASGPGGSVSRGPSIWFHIGGWVGTAVVVSLYAWYSRAHPRPPDPPKPLSRRTSTKLVQSTPQRMATARRAQFGSAADLHDDPAGVPMSDTSAAALNASAQNGGSMTVAVGAYPDPNDPSNDPAAGTTSGAALYPPPTQDPAMRVPSPFATDMPPQR